MKKIALGLLALSCTFSTVFSQSRVFKEVNNDISTQVSTILQDNSVIGYLVFSRLEKVSQDLYNYKITIMDENLNDIGSVNFKDGYLHLRSIAFEQDVLCIGYFKSNMYENVVTSKKKFEALKASFKNSIKLQFLGLDGKIIDTISAPVDIEPSFRSTGAFPSGDLKYQLQVKNIADLGFACVYGDAKSTQLTIFKHTGNKVWNKSIKEEPARDLQMVVSGSNVFILADGKENKNIKKQDQPNSYELLGFNVKDSSAYPKVTIKDKKGHQLQIFTFSNEPGTSAPYISGYLKNTRKSAHAGSINGLARGHYAGVFAYNITAPEKKGIKELFTYWDEGENAQISPKGYLEEQRCYTQCYSSFKDFEGNTYFTADGVVRKFSIGRTLSSLIYIPLAPLNPLGFYLAGTRRGRLGDPLLIKQDPKGNITTAALFEGEKYKSSQANLSIDYLNKRGYFTVTNYEQKQLFLVITEKKNSTVYNVSSKKTVRNFPLKENEISRAILPAKEGHILISEYNKKEKSTRVSIEAL